MHAIQVESGIPLPKKEEWLPVAAMKVGDSVLIPGKNRAMASKLALFGSKRAGLKMTFTTATAVGGTRVWRIA